MIPFVNSEAWLQVRWYEPPRQPRAPLNGTTLLLVALLAAFGGAAMVLGDRGTPTAEPTAFSAQSFAFRMSLEGVAAGLRDYKLLQPCHLRL
jgi:hypothetical protein